MSAIDRFNDELERVIRGRNPKTRMDVGQLIAGALVAVTQQPSEDVVARLTKERDDLEAMVEVLRAVLAGYQLKVGCLEHLVAGYEARNARA